MAATLRNGQVAWQAFQPWPAEQLAVIGGGRRAYVQDTGPAAAQADAAAGAEQRAAGDNGASNRDWQAAGPERLRRAAASVEGYPDVVVGERGFGWVSGGWPQTCGHAGSTVCACAASASSTFDPSRSKVFT